MRVRRTTFARAIAVAMSIAAAASASRAAAYRTFADDPTVAYPARWDDGPIAWDISSAELGSLEPDTLELASRRAFQAWESVECMPLTAVLTGVVPAPAAPGDRRSTISVVASDWEARGFPPGRGATTDVEIERADDGTARIVEADVYLNLADYELVTEGAGPGELDLQAVLTHEVGHVLGLLHPCELAGAGGAPNCASDATFATSALHPEYDGDAARAVSADDVAGICSLYAPEPVACEPACAAGSTCRGGECVLDACVGEACLPVECSDENLCPVGACAVAGEHAGYCVANDEFGAPCSSGSECGSGLCLTSMRAGSYCTDACVDDSDCAGMQQCATVDSRRVCAPMVVPASCASVRTRGRYPLTGVALVLAGILAVVRRRSPTPRRSY